MAFKERVQNETIINEDHLTLSSQWFGRERRAAGLVRPIAPIAAAPLNNSRMAARFMAPNHSAAPTIKRFV